jgi:tetratricopeptide (TPR) repeat protein
MSRITFACVFAAVTLCGTLASARDLPPDIDALVQSEKYSQAIPALRDYLTKEKKSVEGWTALGFAFYFTDQDDSAAAAFQAALEISKKYWPAIHGEVLVLTRRGDFDKADERTRWAIKNTKDKPITQAMFHHDLGLLQLEQDLLDSADINFYIAISQAPDSCQYRLDLGEINFNRKSYPMAISAYEDVLKCDPSLAGPVYHRIARAYLFQREFEPAIAAYRKSAEAHPTFQVYSDLGDALILESRSLPVEDTAKIFDLYRRAIAAYQDAKENAPDGCRIYEKLGKAQALMGRLEGAVEDFYRAIECGTEDPNVFFAAANVLIDLGRFDEAIDQYRHYQEIRSAKLKDHPWAAPDADFFANYGLAYRAKADSTAAGPERDSLYDLAITNSTRALELDSSRAGILGDMGIVLFNMNRFREAIPIFKRKIQMEPDLTNGYLNLAYCYLQLKQYDSVLTALDGMLAVDSCNQKAFEIGGYVAAFELKSGSLARKWYNRQLACYPNNCDAQMYIGYTYLVTNDTGQIRQAIPTLKRAYECRLAKGDAGCAENTKQNALWLAEAYLAIRDLEQAVKWSDKVLACEPGHKRAREIKKQAESEY